MGIIRRIALVTLLLGCSAGRLDAQTVDRVIIDALEGNGDCNRPQARCRGTRGQFGGIGGLGWTTEPEVVAALLKQQITTLPVGTSSGGFTWEFDSSVGLMVRRTQSFGPIFGDRPVTIGARRLSIGLTFQHTEWRSLAGQDLEDGIYGHDLFLDDFYTPTLQPVFEQFGSRIDVSTERTTFNFTYGLTSRLDFNVIVPIARATATGGPDYSRTLVRQGITVIVAQDTASRSAYGLSDISFRGKYLAVAKPAAAVAAVGEVRVPTGDSNNLLGSGKAAAKMSAVGSVAAGPVSPHVEVGYLFAGDGLTFTERFGQARLASAEPSDEITYNVGADMVIANRMTVAVDVLGRTLRNSADLVRTVSTQSDSIDPMFAREIASYRLKPGPVSLLLGTVGAKIQVASSWLLTAGVLFALNDSGVKPQPTPVIGFERAF